MMNIDNNEACFVRLWLRLEYHRRWCELRCKRYCIRSLLKSWFGARADDDFIWEVCHLSEQEGWNQLPPPALYPHPHRELLRAIVRVCLNLTRNQVDIRALDRAFGIAFPGRKQLNIGKKRVEDPLAHTLREDSSEEDYEDGDDEEFDEVDAVGIDDVDVADVDFDYE